MTDGWMTPEHVAAALDGLAGNEVAQAYTEGWWSQPAPEPPKHVQEARGKGDAAPIGMHTCQSARADGASWAYYDEFWYCPFCKERGEGWEVTDSVG